MKNRSAIVALFAGALAVTGIGLVSTPHHGTAAAVQTASAADAPPQVGPVGVVDYNKVLKELGWETKLNDHIKSYGDQLTKEFNDYEARYSRQVGDMQATLKGLGDKLTQQQQNEFVQTVNATRQTLVALRQRGNEEINLYRNEWLRRYKEALAPTVKQIAEQRHMGAVLASTDLVVYLDPAADLSNAVVEAAKKQPPTLTDVPMPSLPQAPQNVGPNMLATTQPTTQPATPVPAVPQPAKKP
jgi:outer membrane protein